jgi:hypothetical protein
MLAGLVIVKTRQQSEHGPQLRFNSAARCLIQAGVSGVLLIRDHTSHLGAPEENVPRTPLQV